ncbi:unnamed protein product, partial [Prorocentrum cordatum]
MAAEAGAVGVQLLDSRGVGKVPTFSGKREDLEDRIFPFESYRGLLGWTAGLEMARDADEQLRPEDLGDQRVQVGRSLYQLLASTTKGTAQSIVNLRPRGDGFETMRRLYGEYRPRLNDEHGQMLQQILTPLGWKEREGKERFTEVLVAWDELVSRYERATGEEVTQNMKTSAIMAHAPDDRDVWGDIGQMRNCIFEAVIGRSGVIAKPPTASRSSNDMDVDAISKGKGKDGKDKCQICNKPNHAARDCFWRDKDMPKGDGKGRGAAAGGKGFGKDGKGKGKGKGSYAFTGKCDYCRKTGRKNADCRKRIADEKAKGNAAIEQESTELKTVTKIECAEFECEICDDDQLYCTAVNAADGDAECCGMELDGATFITLDTASDCYVGPTAFGEGCRKMAGDGPRLLGAQRQVMDKAVESWLSAKTGACMYPALLREGQEIVLHPDSRVEDTRTRPRELGRPICGRKNELWARLSDAERRITAHRARMKELERRQSEQPMNFYISRELHGARPAREEMRRPSRARSSPSTKDAGKAQITLDFCYLKTNGDWAEIGGEEPPAADIFATTLVMADRGALMFNAVSMPIKAVIDYAVASACSFVEGMHLTTADIKTDGEPTILNLAEAKVRTYKFDLEKRYGMEIPADAPIWTSHQAAFGVTYNGDVLPVAETALFKVLISHARQIAATSLRREGESSFVAGIWIGKHKESDDGLFLTPAGWHHARTYGGLGPALRADAKLTKAVKALPWEARSPKPCELLSKVQRPLPTIALTAAEQKAKAEEENAMEEDAPMTPRGQVRPADGENFGTPGKRARHVDAVSLDDPIDYSILDSLGTASYVATRSVGPAVELKGKRCALEVLAHYGVHVDIPRSESGEFKMIKGGNRGTCIADCVKAYNQVDQTEKACVEPPPQYLAILAEMCRCEREPQFYHRKEKEILIEVHMVDFHGGGPMKNLGGIIARLREVFDLKATGVIRQGRYSHLNRRRLRLMSGDVMLRPNRKHIEDLIFAMGTEKAKPAKVPSLTEEGPSWSPDLDEVEKAKFARASGSRSTSPPTADIQRGVQLLTRHLSQPMEIDRKRLVKLAGNLKPGEVKLQMFTDTGFATCKETRRAMTGGFAKLDGVHFAAFARRQGAQETSSGQFYGATSVVMGGKLVKNVLDWLGYKVTWELGIDSSAAKAMINREGVGKVKHLDVGALRIQQGRKVHGLDVKKESGEKNVADLGAKAHPVASFEYFRELAGVVDCGEMDKHKEAGGVIGGNEHELGKERPAGHLAGSGAAGSSAASTCAVESYEPRAANMVAEAIQNTIYEYTGQIIMMTVVVLLGGLARGYYCRKKLMEPPEVKFTDKPMKTCEKGEKGINGPIASGKAKVKTTNQPIMIDETSQAPCKYKWKCQRPRFVPLPE